MEAERHIARADQLAREMGTLEWASDAELILEGVMHEATHRLNARLHQTDVTDVAEDLIHVGMPREIADPPDNCIELIASLRDLEAARARYVRGPLGPDDDLRRLVQRAREAMVE